MKRAVCYLIQFTGIVLYAQETINNASIAGRVTDPAGGVIQDAQVTARQLDTNAATTATTDREGRYRFPYLRLGAYDVTVQRPGFARVTARVTLTVGAALQLPIQLPLAETTTDVTVRDELPLLEAGRSQVAGTVTQSEVSSLPLNGRNFLDLALLIPGVSPTTWKGAESLQDAPVEQQVDGVVGALLGGGVSPDTRAILVSGKNPFLASAAALDSTPEMARPKEPVDPDEAMLMLPDPGAGPRVRGPARDRAFGKLQPPMKGLALIVGLAIGSPEFQRR